MKNLTWQNPEQLFVAQELINKVKSKCCGIKVKYVEDTPATKAEGSTFTPQDYRIKLVSAIAVDSYSTRYASSVEDMEAAIPETAPIVTLEPTDNYGQTYKPWMYGAEMLVAYFLENGE